MNGTKNFFCVLLCFSFLFSPCFAQVGSSAKNGIIEDEFVEKTLDKSLIVPKVKKTYYKDDFALDTLSPDLKIKSVSKQQYNDFYTYKIRTGNLKIKPVADVKYYDFFEKKDTEIPIRIKRYLTTGSFPQEGAKVYFETLKDVKINDTLYPKGTEVRARVETVSLNKSYGVPSDIVVGNFYLKDIALQGEIKKTGANRTIWVYPCSYVGCMFFGLGLLLIPIRGGHAKIKPSETFVFAVR